MKDPIVILHGWASTISGDRYKELKLLLEEKGYKVFTPDMPGFGKSKLKKDELLFEDYIKFVKNFVSKQKLKKTILLGHSFGGRVAIRFAAEYPELVSKLILVGASGIPRPLPSIKKKFAFYATKISRPIFIIPPFSFFYKFFRKLVYYAIGEMDYYKAGKLSKTFQNVYKISIVENLSKISKPVLIVWGENDTITPLKDGKIMHEKIKGSKLVIIPKATHRLPYENPNAFVKEIIKFLR
ncbi:MAG TPA: alpha/beta hydrolase [Patescibacteria group bacterium]